MLATAGWAAPGRKKADNAVLTPSVATKKAIAKTTAAKKVSIKPATIKPAAIKPAAIKPAPAKVTTTKAADAPTSRIVTRAVGQSAQTAAPSVIGGAAVSGAAVESLPAAPESTPSEESTLLDNVPAGDAQAAPTRIAEATNTPAAAPEEDQEDPKLEVPVDPEGTNLPDTTVTITPPPGTISEGVAPGTDPTVTPAPITPPPPVEDTGLTPEAAEGREIATLRVVGNRVISETAILLAISATKPGAAYSPRQSQLDIRRVRDLGFFAAVDVQVTPNLQDPNKVDVAFVVIENRSVTGFRFTGNNEVKAEDLEKVLVTKTGALLNSNNVNEDVKKIQGIYNERGFAALVTDVKQEDDGTVVYTIQEGVISKIELTGLKKTKPSIVRSVIRTKPGDPFNEQMIQRDLNRIYDTDFFEDVTYKVADDPDTPGALIVTISVKEKRTGQFSVGVGFDSRSKISGFVGISESNFRGSGKNVSAQVELGAQRSFNLGFGDRFVGDRNASYSVNLYSNRIFREPRSVERLLNNNQLGDEERFSYQEERVGGRLNYTHPLDLDRTRNLLFGYRNERVRLFLLDDDDDSVPVDLPEDSSGRVSALSVGFLRDKRDLRLDPSRGGRELLILEHGFSFLGGSSNFTKADLDVRRYVPLIRSQKRGEQPRLVLAGRFVVGQTFGQLPAFEQYFIGGSETVRGYDSDEQFGDNQLYGNLELRYRLQRKFQIVGFVDAGSAYGGDFSSSESFDFLVGVGVGVRLTTPIGPVRLDIAKGDDGVKTHFGIGSSF